MGKLAIEIQTKLETLIAVMFRSPARILVVGGPSLSVAAKSSECAAHQVFNGHGRVCVFCVENIGLVVGHLLKSLF